MKRVIKTLWINPRSIAFKAASFLCLLSFGLVLLAAQPGQAQAISLKDTAIIEGNTIKLGDLFYGLNERSERVLGAAPRPGHDIVLNARTLMRIAIALDLPWRPTNSAEQITLRRAATLIGATQIENALKDALHEKGLNGKYSLRFSTERPELILPPEQPMDMAIRSLDYDPQGKRFTATLVAPSLDQPLASLQVHGSIHKMVSIPVLRESLRNGTVIGRNDIRMIDVYERLINEDTILKAERLISMTPRRMISHSEPISVNEIEAPRIVARGKNVTMIFEHAGLTLTALGKALEHGAKGDTIRVSNTSSNKTIQAIVTGENEVRVQAF